MEREKKTIKNTSLPPHDNDALFMTGPQFKKNFSRNQMHVIHILSRHCSVGGLLYKCTPFFSALASQYQSKYLINKNTGFIWVLGGPIV